MTPRRIAIVLGVVLTLAVLAALARLAPRMHPVRRATPAQFWRTIAQVDIGDPNNWGFGIVTHRYGRLVFTIPSMDDTLLAWIPETEATATWPVAEAALERLLVTDPASFQAVGYARWKAVRAELRGGFVGLNHAIAYANIERIRRENPEYPRNDNLYYGRQYAAEECAAKMDRYYATFCFEFVYFSALIWWLLWPVIRGGGIWRYALHWCAAPALLLLPMWLGYAFPVPHILETGGILYSWLQPYLGHGPGNAAWEIRVLSHLPPILAPLSQHVWFDEWESELWQSDILRVHGPISAMIGAGAILTLIIGGKLWHRHVLAPWWEKHRPRVALMRS